MHVRTCVNLENGVVKVLNGAETCLEILERWQGRQSLAHWLQSVLTDGQTKRSVTTRKKKLGRCYRKVLANQVSLIQ